MTAPTQNTAHPLVTIAVPTYNRASGYLREALGSALNQTYPNLDIIVSDNCSPDDTEEVVATLGGSRVRYFRQSTPLSPNDNFNFCLGQARGDYFLLLHDDDVIDRDFVQICLRAAKGDTSIGLIRAGVRTINPLSQVTDEGTNDVVGLSAGDFFLAWFQGRTAHYCCNTLFNTRALRGIGGFHSRHNCFQDAVAAFSLLATHGRVDVPAVKASARVHRGKLAHATRVREWCEDSQDLLELMCKLAPERAAEIRRKGVPYFSRVNYSRAGVVHSLWGRIKAFFLVYRFFEYRYPPTVNMLFRTTAFYRRLRSTKRMVLGLPPWIE